jgi:secondary thiamine-phosphate synthase enzyme
MSRLELHSDRRRQVVDITDQVEAKLPAGHSGAVVITVLHTTAAVTTADLDPGTDLDLLDALEGLLPQRKWRHPHNPAHAPDHLLSSLIGPSVTIPARDGRLVLGTWQRIILIELDGPRERNLVVTALPGA